MTCTGGGHTGSRLPVIDSARAAEEVESDERIQAIVLGTGPSLGCVLGSRLSVVLPVGPPARGAPRVPKTEQELRHPDGGTSSVGHDEELLPAVYGKFSEYARTLLVQEFLDVAWGFVAAFSPIDRGPASHCLRPSCTGVWVRNGFKPKPSHS